MARPAKELDFALVHKLASFGLTLDQIGAVAGCNKRTLERRCRRQLILGRLEGEGKLQAKMWATAMGGNVNMMIFLAKNRLGYVDRPETVVNVMQTTGGTSAQPNAAEFQQRFAAAQAYAHKFLLQHHEQQAVPPIPGDALLPDVGLRPGRDAAA